MQYFDENELPVLEWPGNSPDLNPIEHLWSIIKYKIPGHQPRTKADLKRVITTVWEQEITRGTLKNLYSSMPRRLQAVIDSNGGHTKY
jgi:transposase